MPTTKSPRKGSLQFWPRKRARKFLPSTNWSSINSEKGLKGFICYKVGMVLRSGAHNDTKVFREFNDTVEKMSVTSRIARRGMILDFGDGVYAEIIFPDREIGRASCRERV